MNIKKIAAAATAMAMAAALSACGTANAENAEITTAETTQAVSLSPEEQVRYDMVQCSFVSFGNTYRIEEKLSKAANGEEMTVAYIGGSITEGVGAPTKDECYAKLSYNYIAENYGTGENVKYVNAGVSGTPSILGNLRVEKDVLVHNPDIVFVEFAVNDGMDNLYKQSYESLIRTILNSENEPAVVLLFTVTKEGHTCQPHMQEIGEYYELPMISVPDAIQPEIEAGRMTWADYANDSAHPNTEGHKLVAGFIENWFETLKKRSAKESEYTVKPVAKFGNPYENAVLAEADYDNSNEYIKVTDTGNFPVEARRIADFEKGAWVYDGNGRQPLKMTVTGNSLFLVCKRNNSSTMGKFDVYIGGEKAATIDTNQSDGWGDPWAFQVIKWQGVKEMEVEIVPSEDNIGQIIEIFAIGCSQNASF